MAIIPTIELPVDDSRVRPASSSSRKKKNAACWCGNYLDRGAGLWRQAGSSDRRQAAAIGAEQRGPS